ncbi:hypothetical protein MAR_018083, partial [Mya arenaria]
RSLGQSCGNVNECITTSNVVCNGSCTCQSDYYSDQGANTCTKRQIYESCDVTSQCSANHVTCSSSFCRCLSGFYFVNPNTCTKRDLGQSCNEAGQCSDGNTYCLSSCKCNANYFDNQDGIGGSCELKKELDESCPSLSESAPCKDPIATCSLETCQCPSNYYDSNGAIPAGSCQRRITLNGQCDTSHSNLDQCAADNAICNSTTGYFCKCTSGYYEDPSNAAKCKAKPNPPTWKEATDVNPANDHSITVSWNAPSGSVYGYQVSLLDGSTTVLSTAIISKSQSNTVDSVPLIEVIKTEVIERQIYESCDVTSQCSANHVTCSSSFCRCLSGFYFVNPNTCTKRDLGQSCNEAGQCSDGNTYCLSSCKCNANYFDNQDGIGGSCELKKELDESCPSLSESAPCKDPIATCSLETCQCPSNYYDSNGAIPAGSCQRKSTCKCTSDYFDTNTVNTNYGSCIRSMTI